VLQLSQVQSARDAETSPKKKEPASEAVLKELYLVSPIIALNQKIFDRLTLAQELQDGLSFY